MGQKWQVSFYNSLVFSGEDRPFLVANYRYCVVRWWIYRQETSDPYLIQQLAFNSNNQQWEGVSPNQPFTAKFKIPIRLEKGNYCLYVNDVDNRVEIDIDRLVFWQTFKKLPWNDQKTRLED